MSARNSFLLRTDPQTMAALRKWASDELRSVNAQVEFLLRRALTDAGRLPDKPAAQGRSSDDADHEAN